MLLIPERTAGGRALSPWPQAKPPHHLPGRGGGGPCRLPAVAMTTVRSGAGSQRASRGSWLGGRGRSCSFWRRWRRWLDLAPAPGRRAAGNGERRGREGALGGGARAALTGLCPQAAGRAGGGGGRGGRGALHRGASGGPHLRRVHAAVRALRARERRARPAARGGRVQACAEPERGSSFRRYAFLRPVILQGLTDNSVSAGARRGPPALPALPLSLLLVPAEVPGPVFPRKAAGFFWGQCSEAEHCQHLLLPER